jgi:hypothetical protein
MKTYAVKTRFVFSGIFHVNAENKAKAKEYVESHCGLVLGGNIHSSLSGENLNWDFPAHPEKAVGRVLLNRAKKPPNMKPRKKEKRHEQDKQETENVDRKQ